MPPKQKTPKTIHFLSVLAILAGTLSTLFFIVGLLFADGGGEQTLIIAMIGAICVPILTLFFIFSAYRNRSEFKAMIAFLIPLSPFVLYMLYQFYFGSV